METSSTSQFLIHLVSTVTHPSKNTFCSMRSLISLQNLAVSTFLGQVSSNVQYPVKGIPIMWIITGHVYFWIQYKIQYISGVIRKTVLQHCVVWHKVTKVSLYLIGSDKKQRPHARRAFCHRLRAAMALLNVTGIGLSPRWNLQNGTRPACVQRRKTTIRKKINK